jgi:hypothetical protein
LKKMFYLCKPKRKQPPNRERGCVDKIRFLVERQLKKIDTEFPTKKVYKKI